MRQWNLNVHVMYDTDAIPLRSTRIKILFDISVHAYIHTPGILFPAQNGRSTVDYLVPGTDRTVLYGGAECTSSRYQVLQYK